jgi:hypothetical protein
MAGEARAAWGGGERPVAAVPALFSMRQEKKAGWADWAEIQRENLFGIKIRFLNLPRLWKFVQGDLGGILMWGFFLNSSRIVEDF